MMPPPAPHTPAALFHTRRMGSPPPRPRPRHTWQIVPQWTHLRTRRHTPYIILLCCSVTIHSCNLGELVAQLPTTGGGIEAGSTQNAPGRGTGTKVLAAHCQWSTHPVVMHTTLSTQRSRGQARTRQSIDRKSERQRPEKPPAHVGTRFFGRLATCCTVCCHASAQKTSKSRVSTHRC